MVIAILSIAVCQTGKCQMSALKNYESRVMSAQHVTIQSKKTSASVRKDEITTPYSPRAGIYYLVCKQGGLGWCIDVNASEVGGKAGHAQLSQPSGSQYQIWYIARDPAVNGSYIITSNIDRNKYLQPENDYFSLSPKIGWNSKNDTGQSITWNPINNTAYQAWSFIPTGNQDRTYFIHNLGSGDNIEGIADPRFKPLAQDIPNSNDDQMFYLQLIQAD